MGIASCAAQIQRMFARTHLGVLGVQQAADPARAAAQRRHQQHAIRNRLRPGHGDLAARRRSGEEGDGRREEDLKRVCTRYKNANNKDLDSFVEVSV